MADWKKVENVKEFLSRKGRKRTQEHAFTKRVLHWPYCAGCGLMLLKNELTRKAANSKCVVYDD